MKLNLFKLFEYDNYSEFLKLNVWIALGVCDLYLTIHAEDDRL